MNKVDIQNAIVKLERKREFFAIVGAVMAEPSLLRSKDVDLSPKDFHSKFQSIIFGNLNNIIFKNEADMQKVTAEDLDGEISKRNKQYEIYDRQDGYTFLKEAYETANPSTFKSNYETFKKYALLRTYVKNGIDVKELFDYDEEDFVKQAEQQDRIDGMTIDEIIDYFSLKMNALRDEWRTQDDTRAFKAGDGILELLDKLKESPDFGLPFNNLYYNTIFRGMRKGKLMIRSSNTAGGKTRQAVADMARISMPKLWSNEKNDFVDNPYCVPALIISTELDKQELQTMVLAYVSGISEEVIVEGKYDEGSIIHKRLVLGTKIIARSDFYMEYMPDFSIGDVETTIESYILKHKVEHIAFDYIQITPKLSRTIMASFGAGTSLREDQILRTFTVALKSICEKQRVFIMTSTQLNRTFKDKDERDTNSLRGGSAQADPIDMGVISLRTTEQDLNNIKGITQTKKTPNYAHHIYKNRGAQVTEAIVWTIMDLGVMQEEVLFVTNKNYTLININPTLIELKDGNNQPKQTRADSDLKYAKANTPVEDNGFGHNPTNEIPDEFR